MSGNYSAKRMKEYLLKSEKGEDVSNFLFTPPKNKEQAQLWDYKFWQTQPVTQLDSIATLPKIINNDLEHLKTDNETIMYKPYEWKEFDLNNELELSNVVNFLNKNYNDHNDEKNKKKFSQIFTNDYIKWVLDVKNKKGGVLGIVANSKIGGIICFTIKNMQCFDLTTEVCDVMYMCIHKSLREKGLAELMMKELTRRTVQKGIKIGMFSTYSYVPTPICEITEYQRPINYQKLYNLGFVTLDNKNELPLAISEYKIVSTSKGTKMSVTYIEEAYKKLCEYQDKYNIYEVFTLEQFIETFLDNNCVSSFVIMDKDNNVKDFYSYYKYSIKDNKIIKNDESDENVIKCAKMFIYTSNEITPLSLFKNAIIDAYGEGADVFMCSDIMENNEVCYDNVNKFTQTTSIAYLNTYNWECPEISPEQISKITFI